MSILQTPYYEGTVEVSATSSGEAKQVSPKPESSSTVPKRTRKNGVRHDKIGKNAKGMNTVPFSPSQLASDQAVRLVYLAEEVTQNNKKCYVITPDTVVVDLPDGQKLTRVVYKADERNLEDIFQGFKLKDIFLRYKSNRQYVIRAQSKDSNVYEPQFAWPIVQKQAHTLDTDGKYVLNVLDSQAIKMLTSVDCLKQFYSQKYLVSGKKLSKQEFDQILVDEVPAFSAVLENLFSNSYPEERFGYMMTLFNIFHRQDEQIPNHIIYFFGGRNNTGQGTGKTLLHTALVKALGETLAVQTDELKRFNASHAHALLMLFDDPLFNSKWQETLKRESSSSTSEIEAKHKDAERVTNRKTIIVNTNNVEHFLPDKNLESDRRIWVIETTTKLHDFLRSGVKTSASVQKLCEASVDLQRFLKNTPSGMCWKQGVEEEGTSLLLNLLATKLNEEVYRFIALLVLLPKVESSAGTFLSSRNCFTLVAPSIQTSSYRSRRFFFGKFQSDLPFNLLELRGSNTQKHEDALYKANLLLKNGKNSQLINEHVKKFKAAVFMLHELGLYTAESLKVIISFHVYVGMKRGRLKVTDILSLAEPYNDMIFEMTSPRANNQVGFRYALPLKVNHGAAGYKDNSVMVFLQRDQLLSDEERKSHFEQVDLAKYRVTAHELAEGILRRELNDSVYLSVNLNKMFTIDSVVSKGTLEQSKS